MKLLRGNKKNINSLDVAIGSNLIFMLLMLLVMRPGFETNDDIVFAELGSGLRGVKDAHLVFQNYGLGLLYRLLYEITGRLPWYTIVQYAVLFVSFTVVTYVLINRLEGNSGLYLSILLVLGFGYEGYIHLQFTKTAGIATAAAVFLLLYLLSEKKISWSGMLIVVLLGTTGFMYRSDQFLASGALMVGAGLYYLLNLRECFGEKAGKRLGVCVASLVILFAAVFAVDRWDTSQYQSPQWQEYKEFNQLRSELLDYGFPDYERNRELYKELGISREALKLYQNWNFNDTEKFTPEVMHRLTEQKARRPLTGKVVANFLQRFPRDLLQLPMFYYFGVFLLLWLVFAKKNIKSLVSVIAELLLLAGIYFYLYYQGRYMVNRVDVGLWFSGSLCILWLLSGPKCKVLEGRTGIAVLAAGVLLSQFLWHSDWRITTSTIPEARVAQRAVLETIGTDKEHIYLAKSGTLSEIVCYGPFDRMPETLLDNVFWFGGWECRTPEYADAMEAKGIRNPYRDIIGNDKAYLVDDDIDLTLKYIREYYEPEAEAVFVKTVGNVNLYQIKKKG